MEKSLIQLIFRMLPSCFVVYMSCLIASSKQKSMKCKKGEGVYLVIRVWGGEQMYIFITVLSYTGLYGKDGILPARLHLKEGKIFLMLNSS